MAGPLPGAKPEGEHYIVATSSDLQSYTTQRTTRQQLMEHGAWGRGHLQAPQLEVQTVQMTFEVHQARDSSC